MKNNQQNSKTRIAVPYYGALSLPHSGLSRLFFLADVCIETRSIEKICIQVWNPKKFPNLSTWMRQLGTEGLICSDNPSHHETAFNSEGIWVQWRQEGEVHTVIERWLRSRCKALAFNPEPQGGCDAPGITLEPLWQLC
ncbi:MAG: hypothetical protein HYV06_10665 [Deltaproteobacteria bacterium]|nr:hypothetical protein [Deltaproteobacteria bacterium]